MPVPFGGWQAILVTGKEKQIVRFLRVWKNDYSRPMQRESCGGRLFWQKCRMHNVPNLL